ncbi:MAG: hypothetical protein IJY80_07065, partial [Opitutales bacterium]|nr:hypothetical protein [Opitutales bacterium]
MKKMNKFVLSTLVAAAAMTSTAWAEGTESTTPVLPTLTVDSSAKEGDEGFGVTKFATVDAAVKAAQSTSGATINLGMLSRPSDFPLRNDDSTLWRTNGDYTFAGGNYGDLFSWIQTPKPSEASDVHINIAFDKANVVAGKFRLDNGSSLTITDSQLDSRGYLSDNRGWTTFYGDSTINIKNSVVGYHAKDNATDGRDADSRNIVAGDKTTNYSSYDAGMVFGGSGVMTVEKSTIFALTNANRTYGALAVYARGLMEFKDSAVYARSLSIGIDDNSTVGRDEEVATMVFDASVLRDINGDDSAFIKVGDSLAGKLIVKNNAEIDHVNATMTVNNNGYVSVSDSTLKVGSLSNNGEFTVSGTSTLNIGTLSGNVIDLLDGATLTDSAVGGFMRVNGSVAIKGDSSVGRIDLGYDAYTQDATQLDITGTLASTAQIIIGNEDGDPSATVNIGAADSARTSASFSGALNVRENGIVKIVNADVTTSQYRNRGSVSVTNGTLYGTWESNGIASKVEGQVATLALDDATFKKDVEKNSHFTLNVGQVDSGSALTETAEGSGKITMENNSLLHVGKLNLYNAGEGMTVAVEADSSTINVVSDVYVGTGATVSLKDSLLKATNITSN